MIRNSSTGEYLYTGSKTLDSSRRHALTWIGKANADPAMLWVLEPQLHEGNEAVAPPSVAHLFTAPTPASLSAAAVFDAAIAAAGPDAPVGSEHLLWGLLNVQGYSPRILDWMGSRVSSVYGGPSKGCGEGSASSGQPAAASGSGSGAQLRSAILETLSAKGFNPAGTSTAGTTAGTTAGSSAAPPAAVTHSVERVLAIVKQISNGPVSDGGVVLEHGLVATEFIVAAILVEGRSVAADVLSRASRGLVHAANLLEAISVDSFSLLVPASSPKAVGFEARAVNCGWEEAAGQGPWEPTAGQLPDVGDGAWCSVPAVPYANWAVAGRLMIGETPGGDSWSKLSKTKLLEALDALAPSHVDAFVCLRGEWGSTSDFVSRRYPSALESSGKSVDVIYCPIEDFCPTADAHVLAVVLECRRRLRAGQRLYVHCRSGHGRTGMVVVPLVAALFDVSAEAARQFVQQAHDIGRNGGGDAGWHLPETAEQLDVVRRVNELVRATDISAKGPSGSAARGRR